MDRSDLIAYWSRAIRDFSYAPDDAKRYALRVSSGTSGRGAMMALTPLTPAVLADWFSGQGRVVLCFGSRAIRLFNLLGTLEAGLDALALDAEDLAPERVALIEEFKPTRFHGFPSFILRAAAGLSKETCAGVDSLLLVGELITDSMAQALRERFPHARMRTTYAASELGGITKTSCGHLPRNHYHVLPRVTVVIDEPDESGVGEIVVSKMVGDVQIEGYKTGDLGRLYDISCACGMRGALEVLGRAGADYLKVGGAMLRIEEFDRALAAHRPAIADYRVEATTLVEGGVPKGLVRVILYAPALPTQELQRLIAEDLMAKVRATPTRTLGQLMALGLFAPLEVHFTVQPLNQGHKKSVRMRYLTS